MVLCIQGLQERTIKCVKFMDKIKKVEREYSTVAFMLSGEGDEE